MSRAARARQLRNLGEDIAAAGLWVALWAAFFVLSGL
jgi:hypothetical protein